MTVPFLDLQAAYAELTGEIDAATRRVLHGGRYVLGEEVNAFEREFAAYCQCQYAIGVGNGLDALVIALKALDIGAGDDVLVPSNTYIATWFAVSAVGARPIPVEPGEGSYNITPESIKAALTPHTKAIIPVHLYGHPAPIDGIVAFANSHGLSIIEDAAQVHGGRHAGKRIGGHGNIVCWSFYPSKNLGCAGDGGAITTNSSEIEAKIRLLRNYGSPEKYIHTTRGMNSRLDEIQAAILRIKLKKLDAWNARLSPHDIWKIWSTHHWFFQRSMLKMNRSGTFSSCSQTHAAFCRTGWPPAASIHSYTTRHLQCARMPTSIIATTRR